MAINPRKKGHSYELQIRDWFRELGWARAVSSRSESKNKDDQGIDLCFTDPFNVQAKAVEKLGSIHDVLAKMPKDNYNLVFHKRNRKGTIVAMTIEDFKEILHKLIQNQIIKPMILILILSGCSKPPQIHKETQLKHLGGNNYMYIKTKP